MQSISTVLEKMYQLFIDKDLDLVEINPLGINSAGQVMALNGSVRVNDRAIARHPDIAKLATKVSRRYTVEYPQTAMVEGDGSDLYSRIGILGNGVGSVLATLDLIAYAGGKAGMCLNLRHASPVDTSPTTFRSRLEKALQILASDRSIGAILINLIGSIPQVNELSEVIEEWHKQQMQSASETTTSNGRRTSRNRQRSQIPQLVIRLAGTEFEEAKANLLALQTSENLPILIAEHLDAAVSEAIALTKPNQRLASR